MVLFALVGWFCGCLEWALLWEASLIINNLTPVGKTWVFKHVNITVGTFAMMAAAWQIVAPMTPIAMTWVAVTSLIVFPLIAVQDLRDMMGDKAIGRTTLPILLGEGISRPFIAIVFLLTPIVTHLYMVVPAGVTVSGFLCEVILTGICVTIAIRTILFRNKEADHRSYLLFTYWYCALLAAAIVIL
jgi:4-hydroxybenzoate polyprenyltransferase